MTEVEKPLIDLLSKGKENLVSDEPVDMELETSPEEDEDLYTMLKNLQRQLEFYEIQVRHASLGTQLPTLHTSVC